MSMSIREYRDKDSHLVLPAIQREYVWTEDQICQLFDSIMREYPIGNLLLWELDGRDMSQKGLDFYALLPNFDEQKKIGNNKVDNVSPDGSYLAILDGQQRSQSLIIGLSGFLRLRKRYAPVGKADSYVKKYLYINLLTNLPEDSNYKYNFSFLAENEATVDPSANALWFRVGKICQYDNAPSLNAAFGEQLIGLTPDQEQQARDVLNQLFLQICQNKNVLSYVVVDKRKSLDDILDIFVRTNSGGTKLDKTDLLFSTIVTSWNEARDEIENLIESLNDHGLFRFGKDFVMRSFLYMLDESVALKVKDLKKNIESIRKDWKSLRSALIQMRDLLEELGYNDENLKAYNSAMPIAYYIYKGGIIDDDTVKSEFKKYLAISHLKQLYGIASNSALTGVRTQLMDPKKGVLKNRYFRMSDLDGLRFTGDRDFGVDETNIDTWLLHNKKDSYSFYVLSLLYPEKELLRNKFHQDHMHPESKLSMIPEFKDNRNRLANLQLLPGPENEHKLDADFADWAAETGIFKSEEKIERNYLQNCSDLQSIDRYNDFLKERGENMKVKLKEILGIS